MYNGPVTLADALALTDEIARYLSRRAPMVEYADIRAGAWLGVAEAFGQSDAPDPRHVYIHARRAAVDEIRARCGRNGEKRVVSTLESAREPVSFHAPDAFERAAVRQLLERLGPSRRFALESTIAGGLTLAEAGRHLGVSGPRVCQLRESAVEQLRAA